MGKVLSESSPIQMNDIEWTIRGRPISAKSIKRIESLIDDFKEFGALFQINRKHFQFSISNAANDKHDPDSTIFPSLISHSFENQ